MTPDFGKPNNCMLCSDNASGSQGFRVFTDGVRTLDMSCDRM